MTKKHKESSSSSNSSLSKHDHHKKQFEHKIQLQLADSLGFLVPNTRFWVTLTILKEGPKVTIQFPVINFQTGPSSPDDLEPPFVPGGYLYAVDGFLPKKVRPNDIVYRSFLVPSNNGMSLPFSFTQPPNTLPTPPVGYILQVTNDGSIVVQCAGTFANVIPAGPQILLPTDVSYIVKKKLKLSKNTIIGAGFTNVLGFTNPNAINDGVRDTHVNDAFDGILAWSWTSNSDQTDKTNNTMDAFVAIGKISKKGEMKVKGVFNLTKFTGPNLLAWDTAVIINRTNKNNIVVSYGVIDYNTGIDSPHRAVSVDGGKSWPAFGTSLNGPINTQPTGVPSSFGDNRGVGTDKYGNIWYLTTNLFDNFGNVINQPYFAVSTDKGVTFSVVYTYPPPSEGAIYDYPQFAFGGDGQGGYALQFASGYFLANGDVPFTTGLIPITGLGQFGTPQFVVLNSFLNNNYDPIVTASADGRVWYQGLPNAEGAYSYIQSEGIVFKSPGPVDQNYAGPWSLVIHNNLGSTYGEDSGIISQPYFGYPTETQEIIYDDNRQALYATYSVQYPGVSETGIANQNIAIYFIISRDNGQTWSRPIDISTSDQGNRGLQSMALDTVTGNLVFGWYDGRNDPTYESIQYFGAVIPAKTLDKLVSEIPLSNPLYTLPSATGTSSALIAKVSATRQAEVKKRIEKKVGCYLSKRTP